jgi:hypothetical protein
MSFTRDWVAALFAVACMTAIMAPPISAAELEPPRSQPGDQRATSSPPGSAAELEAAVSPADKSADGAVAPREVLPPAPNKSVTIASRPAAERRRQRRRYGWRRLRILRLV